MYFWFSLLFLNIYTLCSLLSIITNIFQLYSTLSFSLNSFILSNYLFLTTFEMLSIFNSIYLQGVSKKRSLFDLVYLRDALVKLIVLLVCYSLLPYNSIKPNFSFLWLSKAEFQSKSMVFGIFDLFIKIER